MDKLNKFSLFLKNFIYFCAILLMSFLKAQKFLYINVFFDVCDA
jgi:hypothetical protein